MRTLPALAKTACAHRAVPYCSIVYAGKHRAQSVHSQIFTSAFIRGPRPGRRGEVLGPRARSARQPTSSGDGLHCPPFLHREFLCFLLWKTIDLVCAEACSPPLVATPLSPPRPVLSVGRGGGGLVPSRGKKKVEGGHKKSEAGLSEQLGPVEPGCVPDSH